MSESRREDYVEEIERLERSNRRWRGLAVGLLVVLAAVAGLGVMQFTRARQAALAQEQQARDAEMRARNVQEFLKKGLP